ncbi:DUF3626 domain-containing protein [Nocardioides aestuarii]|uniref:DUF3626 domain-containing protein n=1 Tax=Nocardioides aestuarii TaxID=252231 RepID=A0ABW4TFU3_9ACTN
MRVTLQLQPNWPHLGGTVIEALARDGRYRSQFETGTSNGGLTAHPGGSRWRWESRLFDGRYDAADPATRPVYGALDRHEDPYGGSIRFGSAYLVMAEHTLERTTFCYPDSVFEPQHVGGPERRVELAGLADADVASGARDDHLDDYVEAHVHGGVDLAVDVEELVIDPCFRGTPVGAAALTLPCEVRFHPGFSVATADLTADYRGDAPLALARSLGEVLTPDVVGDAARSGAHDRQTVKQVWHLLARFGRR